MHGKNPAERFASGGLPGIFRANYVYEHTPFPSLILRLGATPLPASGIVDKRGSKRDRCQGQRCQERRAPDLLGCPHPWPLSLWERGLAAGADDCCARNKDVKGARNLHVLRELSWIPAPLKAGSSTFAGMTVVDFRL